MDFSYITKEEIAQIRKIMGLNGSQFGRIVGAKASSAISNWESGKNVATGIRYEKLLLLKRKFLGDENVNIDIDPERIDIPQVKRVPQVKQEHHPTKANFEKIYECYQIYQQLDANSKNFFMEMIK